MNSSTAADAKRKIGGHYGSAVGASTKRGRSTAWREEVDEVEQLPPAAVVQDDSESDAVVDPGTPLPSESEEEVPAAVIEDSAAGSTGDAAANASDPTENADVAARAIDSSVAEASETRNSQAAEDGPKSSALPEAPPSVASQQSVAIAMDLMLGESTLGSARLLLRDGLSSATEKRLAACLAPAGGTVDDLVKDVVCTFGGHGPLPAAQRRRHAAKARKAESPVEGLPEEAEIGDDTGIAAAPSEASSGAEGRGIGLLFEPLEGDGLALALGSAGAQLLGSTHRLLGHMLTGRRFLSRLQILAPVAEGLAPHQAIALRVLGPATPENEGKLPVTENASVPIGSQAEDISLVPHPFLRLEAVGRSEVGSTNCQPFVLEPAVKEGQAADELEAFELEVNCRDAEVSALKEMPFSRDRQQGVESVIEIFQRMGKSLGDPGPVAPAENVGDSAAGSSSSVADEKLSHQRWWLSQRVQHLLRVLKQLR